jgi:PAS domain S-box-containing protein
MRMGSLFSILLWRNYWMHLRHYSTALLIFLIGLLFSLAAFHFYQMQDLNQMHAEFDRVADLRLFLIKDILLETLEQVDHIKQFFYATANVTRKDFSIFVHNIFNLYPNFLILGWIEAHPSSSSTIGLDFINLNQKSSTNAYIVPFTYLEKADVSQSFYIDSADYTTFLNLLESSQQSLDIIVSNDITYAQGEKKLGFFLFKTIFGSLPFAKHHRGLFGTVVGFSNFEDIVENVRSRIVQLGINISIYNVSEGMEHLLYLNEAPNLKNPQNLTPQEKQIQEQWTRNHVFKFGNRHWKLQATPTLQFIRQHQNEYWRHWEVPIIGILVSALTAFYFFILINRRLLIEQEVHERTNELATINSILQQEIHERQRIEEDFMAKQRYLQRRHAALEYLTKLTVSEIRSAIHEVILRTATVMQVDRVSVWFYKKIDDTEILSCAGVYLLSTNSFSHHLELTSPHFPLYFQALSKRSHLILPSVQDAELNQELSSYLAAFHISSKLDIPIVFEDKLLGILSCEETRGHREWVLEDRHFGQTIADIIAIMIEQSARRKAENALQESEERLRFITQNSIDGIISINKKEEIISWNYGAQQMFGYNEIEMLGKCLRIIIPQDDLLLQNIKNIKPIELKGRHRDGHLFPVEVSQTYLETGKLFFDTIIIRDITERKEYEKRLIQAMRDAKAANAAKSEFLATISHELRTPLNAIIGFNQCLLMGIDGTINDAQRISLKKIENSAFHLLNLINDILDWSKIEAKGIELKIMPHNIIEVIHFCIEEMQPIAQQKHLKIYTSISDSFILIEMDKVRIQQVLLNLLSNAIKFTEKGSIKIAVFNDPHQVRISIIDTGIGLSPEELAKIFHPFTQADSSITRKYGGTGLGLVISKNIVNMHGGKITVESQKGKGSTFTVILPKIH